MMCRSSVPALIIFLPTLCFATEITGKVVGITDGDTIQLALTFKTFDGDTFESLTCQ
jgi:hypothetical protein